MCHLSTVPTDSCNITPVCKYIMHLAECENSSFIVGNTEIIVMGRGESTDRQHQTGITHDQEMKA